MNYYSIEFPFNTTLIVVSNCLLDDVIYSLSDGYRGIKAPSGAIYNTKQFLSVNKIEEPNTRQLRVAQSFYDILVWPYYGR